MKLVISIVQSDDADGLGQALRQKGHRSTRVGSTGGFLREGNATILIGTRDEYVDEIIGIIRENCHARTQYMSPLPPLAEAGELYLPNPVEVEVGGATIFVLNVVDDLSR